MGREFSSRKKHRTNMRVSERTTSGMERENKSGTIRMEVKTSMKGNGRMTCLVMREK